jgi:hypothetical protein
MIPRRSELALGGPTILPPVMTAANAAVAAENAAGAAARAATRLAGADTVQPFIRYLLAGSYAGSRDRVNARLSYEKAPASSAGLDVESVIVRPFASAWLTKNPAGS